jgi:hypothetical protein
MSMTRSVRRKCRYLNTGKEMRKSPNKQTWPTAQSVAHCELARLPQL